MQVNRHSTIATRPLHACHSMSELLLVHRVELRLALAESELQFQQALATFLAPLLLKLASSDPAVRQAVLKCVALLVPRIATYPAMVLPVEALVAQAQSATDLLVAMYLMLFVMRGLPRMDGAAQWAAVVKMASGLAQVYSERPAVAARLFAAIGLVVVESDAALFAAFQLVPLADAAILAQFVEWLLLFDAGASPGLSLVQRRFLTEDAGLTFSTPLVAKHHLAWVKVLESQVLPNTAVARLVASCDPNPAVGDRALLLCKRLAFPTDCQQFVDRCVELVVGTASTTPVRPPVATAMVTILSSNPLAAVHPQAAQVAQTALLSLYRRLHNVGVKFVGAVTATAPSDEVATSVAAQLRLLLTGQGGDKRAGYELLGMLMRQTPELLVVNQLEYLRWLFHQLDVEEGDSRAAVLEALLGVALMMEKVGAGDKQVLRELLVPTLVPGAPSAVLGLKFLVAAFLFNDAGARAACAACVTDSRSDVVEEARRGLSPHWFEAAGRSTAFPSVDSMVAAVTATPLVEGLVFTARCLVAQATAGAPTVVETNQLWEANVDQAWDHDEGVRQGVARVLTELSSLNSFVDLLTDALATGSAVCGEWLARVLVLAPDTTRQRLQARIEQLWQTASARGASLQLAAAIARVVGLVGVPDPALFVSQELVAPTPALIMAVGRIVALHHATLDPELVESVASLLESALDTLLFPAACDALSRLAAFGALPRASTPRLVSKLAPKVARFDDKAVVTLAYLSLDSPEVLTDAVFPTHTSKQVEYLFAAGEALAIAGAGWGAPVVARTMDVVETRAAGAHTGPILEWLVFLANQTKPSLRKALAVWLLVVCQQWGGQVASHAPLLQNTFTGLLADRDEFVQDCASRGLSIVYELGDAGVKDTLVHGLLSQLSLDRTRTSTLDATTELFTPGAMPTGDGLVQTYKDILGLALDVGDPALVYKFMLVARLQAAWALRRGAAFGLGQVLLKTQLQATLRTNPRLRLRLVPRLYRYRFDPLTLVALAMEAIWEALVDDTVVRESWGEILSELLKAMGNKEWRVREAATKATTHLLQTMALGEYELRLPEVWEMAFRALDDIKESVRQAGSKLTRHLATALVGAVGRREGVLGQLVPFLLGPKGIGSDAEDVRAFSIETLLKACGEALPAALGPHVPVLLDLLVGMLSLLEPEVVNYLALNAGRYGVDLQELDSTRALSVGRHPIMSTVERLVDCVDGSNVGQVVSAFHATVGSVVGLPLKTGASRVISLLARQAAVRPYGDALLKTAASQLRDRSETVAEAFAAAAGHACRIASLGAVADYAASLQTRYFDGDERQRVLAAVAVELVSKYGGDLFTNTALAFLPLAYIGQHDGEQRVQEVFGRVWSENTSGSGAVRLYLLEIVTLVETHLSLPQFGMRQTVLRLVAAVVAAVDANEAHVQRLVRVLVAACVGRLWNGKATVLAALVGVVCRFPEWVAGEVYSEVRKTVVTEARRRNREYALEAVIHMGAFMRVYAGKDPLLVGDYVGCVEGVMEHEEDEDEDTVVVEGDPVNVQREEKYLRVVESVVKTVTEETYSVELVRFVLVVVESVFDGRYMATWRSRVAACAGVEAVAKVVPETDSNTWSEVQQVFARVQAQCAGGVEVVAAAATRAAAAVAALSRGS